MNFLKRFVAGFAFAAVAAAASLAIVLATTIASAHFGAFAAVAVLIFGVCAATGMIVALD